MSAARLAAQLNRDCVIQAGHGRIEIGNPTRRFLEALESAGIRCQLWTDDCLVFIYVAKHDEEGKPFSFHEYSLVCDKARSTYGGVIVTIRYSDVVEASFMKKIAGVIR